MARKPTKAEYAAIAWVSANPSNWLVRSRNGDTLTIEHREVGAVKTIPMG